MKDIFRLPILAGASLLVSLSVLISSFFGGSPARSNPNEQALALPVYIVNQGGTGASSFTKYPVVGAGSTGALSASSTLWVVGVNATATTDTLASTFVRSRTTFGTTTNATSTSFFATTASTTNLYGSGLTACTGTSFLQWTGGLFGCATPSAGASWSTTSQDYYASQFNAFKVVSGLSGTYVTPTTTPMGILINNATSTITNLFSVNATSTNATSTNSFATTASSTDLYTSTLGVATSTKSANWGATLATTTVIIGAQGANTIASTTVAEAAGTSILIDWSKGNTRRIILSQNTNIVLSATSSNAIDGGKYLLKVCQDATGSRTASFFPNALRWPTLGATPGATTTISSAANSCTYIGFIYDALFGIYSAMGSTTGIKIN